MSENLENSANPSERKMIGFEKWREPIQLLSDILDRYDTLKGINPNDYLLKIVKVGEGGLLTIDQDKLKERYSDFEDILDAHKKYCSDLEDRAAEYFSR